MKQYAALTIAAMVFAGLAACIHRVPGTYTCAAGGKSLELRSNGTFRIQTASTGFDGTYEVTDHTLTLKNAQGGFAGKATISGDTIQDDDGKVWVKQ